MEIRLSSRPDSPFLEAATAAGINIPTLCYLKETSPTGSCRICVVEVKGADRLLPACATPAEDGMEVTTDNARVRDARRSILEMLVASGRHNCFVMDLPPEDWTDFQLEAMSEPWHELACPAHGDCRLQDLVVEYGVSPKNLIPTAAEFPLDDSHPLIVRDFSRCILCGRCIAACNQVQVNSAIPEPFGRREGRPEVDSRGGGWFPTADYDKCVHCGECVQACPVGALFEKKAYGQGRHWETEKVRTTCPYCGVGCQMLLHVQDGKVVKVTGVDAVPNQGRLCVKGRFGYDFIHSDERLTMPLIKDGDGLPGGLLGGGPQLGRREVQGDQGPPRAQRPGRPVLGPGDQRRKLPDAETGARGGSVRTISITAPVFDTAPRWPVWPPRSVPGR